MKTKLAFVFVTLSFLTMGCTTMNSKLDPNYQAYLNAVSQYHPKLVEIDAQPGQTIELKGVAKFVVYAPRGSRIAIRPYESPAKYGYLIFHDIFSTTLRTAVGILPTYWGWKYGSSILNTALKNSGPHVTGDYVLGTAVKGDYTNGDKVGQDKYTVGGDFVSGTKTGQDYIGQSKYTAGQDYTGQDKNTVTGDYIPGTSSTTTNSYSNSYNTLDNSTSTY